MNLHIEEAEVFTDTKDPSTLREEDDEDTGDEENAKIFSTWMQLYRGGELVRKTGEGGKAWKTEETPVRSERRTSLPCPATLLAMQFSQLHSSTCAPVTANVLLHRSSSRHLLILPQEVTAQALDRRLSLIPTIPEAVSPQRRGQYRRRNAMSLSDADSICLICHNNLNQESGATRELQCTHTFHRECIEEWLWRKQCCPTCHVQVPMPKPVYWSSTRV